MTSTRPAKDPNALKIASFRTKEGVWADFSQKAESMGLTATDILKASMEQFINGSYNPYNVGETISTSSIHNDGVLTRDDVLEIVNSVVSTLPSNGLTKAEVLDIIGESNIPTGETLSQLKQGVAEISEFSHTLRWDLEAVKRTIADRDVETLSSSAKPVQGELSLEAYAPTSGGRESPADDVKTWGEFFKMVGIEALPAAEAQKKENADIRTKQIELGLQAARERGLGEWDVKIVGRNFVRVTLSHADP